MTCPIYIISIKRTPERKLSIKRQLDAFNLSYKFVDGIDRFDLLAKDYRIKTARCLGIDESDMEFKYKNDREQHRFACLLSHIKAYDLMIKNNIPIACILEDDVALSPAFAEVLVHVTSEQPLSWDLLLLSNQSLAVRDVMTAHTAKREVPKFFYKLICYKKNYPDFNLYTLYWIAIKLLQYLFIDCYKKASKPLWLRYAYTSDIGALPIKDISSWHKTIRGHYITEPLQRPTSGMGYILTLPTAIKWKQLALSLTSTTLENCYWQLYSEGKLRLRMLTPPCVKAICNYLYYAARQDYSLT